MDDKPVNPTEREFAFSEALATWSTRYIDASGFECQLVLQAETGSSALAKAQAALAKLSESGCTPLNHQKLTQSGDQKKEPVICPIHNVAMRQYQKNGRVWYSHKLDDGSWCKGGQG